MPIKMSDSFSITLVSNRGKESFPHNNNFQFSNGLPRTMDLRGYEVALESISLSDIYKGDLDEEKIETEPENFFNLEEKENEIFVDKTYTSHLRVDKKTENFNNFLSALQVSLRKVNIPVEITPFFVRGVPSSIQLTYNDPGGRDGYEFYIAEELAKILGFTTEFFDYGTYTNEKPIDIEYFNSLPMEEGISHCMVVKIERVAVEMDQIVGKPDFPDFLNLLQYKVEEHGVAFNCHLKKSIATLTYEIVPVGSRVKLSKFLNNYIELDEDFTFYGEGSIRIPRNIIYPNQPQVSNTKKSFSNLLVFCDIINPQVFAGEEMKILALPDRPESEKVKVLNYHPNPLIYKGLSCSKVSQITISIRDVNNEPIQFHERPTVVTLNFRKT